MATKRWSAAQVLDAIKKHRMEISHDDDGWYADVPAGFHSEEYDKDRTPFEWAYQHCLEAYLNLLDAGVCEEQARLVLPVGSNTTFIWSGSLAAWARVINLRTSDDAQPETRIVADQIATHISSHFPVSYEALCDVR